jgi:hypothetical protein
VDGDAGRTRVAEIKDRCPLDGRRVLAVWPDLMHQAWQTAGPGWAPLWRVAVARIVRGHRSCRLIWDECLMRPGPGCAVGEAEAGDGGRGV